MKSKQQFGFKQTCVLRQDVRTDDVRFHNCYCALVAQRNNLFFHNTYIHSLKCTSLFLQSVRFSRRGRLEWIGLRQSLNIHYYLDVNHSSQILHSILSYNFKHSYDILLKSIANIILFCLLWICTSPKLFKHFMSSIKAIRIC